MKTVLSENDDVKADTLRKRPPSLLQGLLRSVVAVGVLVVSVTAPMGVVALFPQFLAWANDSSQGDWPARIALLVAIYLLTTLLTLAIVAGLLRWWDRKPFSSLGFSGGVSAFGWFIGMIATGTAIAVLPAAAAGALGTIQIQPGIPLWVMLVSALGSAFLIQAIPEETIFRGWLLQAFEGNWRLGLAVTTGVFTVIHLVSSGGQENFAEQLLYLVMPLGFGFAAGVVRIITGSLWPAIGVHGGFHVGHLFIEFFAPDFDPRWYWVAVGLGWALVGVALILWNRGIAPRKTPVASLLESHNRLEKAK